MIPNGKHEDWPFPFNHIPRKWTAISSNKPPKVVLGHGLGSHNPDVPPPGGRSFSISKFGFNFAFTTRGGWHFRIGTFRYDYVDHYFEFPTFTLKHIAVK